MSMNLLILGGAGMLGHKLWQTARPRIATFATVRGGVDSVRPFGFSSDETLAGVDAADFDSIVRAFDRARPSFVVNCIGIIKQLPQATDPIVSIGINSMFPHRLHALCRAAGARLIHVSTDCVFSGRRGGYVETDPQDAEDLYGRSKALGEVAGETALTLRTSIIGRELRGTTGLVEWFLANRGGEVDGYEQAIFSGLTTLALSELIVALIEKQTRLSGLYHVSAAPIDKLKLLRLMNDAYDARVGIRPSAAVRIDRSLDSSRFRAAAGWQPDDWAAMIAAMAADPSPYDEWRRTR